MQYIGRRAKCALFLSDFN